MTARILFGFHAVGVRLKTAPRSVLELHVDPARRDARMQHFVARAVEAGVKLVESSDDRLASSPARIGTRAWWRGSSRWPWPSRSTTRSIAVEGPPLVLVLDGVTDPHNLGACLRVADGAGAHAVVAPKDHAVGINATVAKVASGAAETVPYFMVTNLARTLNELKERDIRIVGTAEDAPRSIYELDLGGPLALVFGAEGKGMRQLTAKTCDELVHLPMQRRGREPQRLGRQRHLPVRSGAAAPDRSRPMTMTEVRHPLVRHKVGLLRAASLSTKSFREITAEIGRLLAYEATADFPLEPATVEGWAGPVQVERISGKKVTLVPILRAGLGMLDGVLDAIPNAKVSVVGIARNHVTLMPEPYVDRLAGELACAHRDRPRPDARDRRLDDLGGVAAQVARRDRHPGAGAGGGTGRHRRARRGASRRPLLDRGDRQPPQRERLHPARARRRRGPDLRHALARAAQRRCRIGSGRRGALLRSCPPIRGCAAALLLYFATQSAPPSRSVHAPSSRASRSATDVGRATQRSKGGDGSRRLHSGDMSGVARPMAVATR